MGFLFIYNAVKTDDNESIIPYLLFSSDKEPLLTWKMKNGPNKGYSKSENNKEPIRVYRAIPEKKKIPCYSEFIYEIICGLWEILQNERSTGRLKMGRLKKRRK